MKDDVKRPLYGDYKKQAWEQLKDNRPVYSRDRLYAFADRPLLMFLFFSLCAAFLFIYKYLPRPGNTVYGITLYLVYIIIAILCITLYLRQFVYRFARFNVMWEDWQRPGAACEGCDELGKFLPTKENRHAAVRSRFAFFALLAAMAAIAALFHIFAWGMAEQRIKSSPLLAEFAQAAEKQGDVNIDIDSYSVLVWSSDGTSFKEISRDDEEEFKRILGELKWNYVESLYWKDGMAHVSLRGGFESRNFDVYFGKQ